MSFDRTPLNFYQPKAKIVLQVIANDYMHGKSLGEQEPPFCFRIDHDLDYNTTRQI